MSHNEKQNFKKIQEFLTLSVTHYPEIIHNQSIELAFDPKKFWIDNALIKTYDYIRMLDSNLSLKRGVSPSTRQMSKP